MNKNTVKRYMIILGILGFFAVILIPFKGSNKELKSSKFFPKNPKLVSQISLITTLGTHLFRRIRL